MLHDVPMLADVGARLAFGLALILLLTSWRAVPLPFFRTHCQVILGLLVLSALDASRSAGWNLGVALLAAGAIFAYAATVTWGLGLPRLAIPATCLIVAAAAGWLALVSRTDSAGAWAMQAATRYSSGFLIGATLSAMLLGHHYLIAPTMSIEPLKDYVKFMSWGLVVRGLLAAFGIWLAASSWGGSASWTIGLESPLMLLMRWGMGFAGPAVATFLAWKTVQIRSTQSATGILYVAMILVLVGELTALVGARAAALMG